MVYLIYGKANAGKTTYALKLVKELQQLNHKVAYLESENIRSYKNAIFGTDNDWSHIGVRTHLLTLAEQAAAYEKSGLVVVVDCICPKAEFREIMQALWKESKLVYIPGGIENKKDDFGKKIYIDFESPLLRGI